MYDFVYGGVILVTWFHKELAHNKQEVLLVICFTLFFLGLFFDPEDGGDMFLRNVVDFRRTTCGYILGYTTPY
jgi:hypothetical protein